MPPDQPSLPRKRSDLLRDQLTELDAWTNSAAFIGWKAAREKEARRYNERVGAEARDWNEVVEFRARRDEILNIADNSFEDARQNLEEAINQAVEEETQLAAASRT